MLRAVPQAALADTTIISSTGPSLTALQLGDMMRPAILAGVGETAATYLGISPGVSKMSPGTGTKQQAQQDNTVRPRQAGIV